MSQRNRCGSGLSLCAVLGVSFKKLAIEMEFMDI
jgi:hypothetical protein